MNEHLEAAIRREDAAIAARPRIDYDRMRVLHPKQKAALTRAVKSGDLDKIVETIRKAVAEWDEIGAWPDDWSRWQRALDDAMPGFGPGPDIRYL